MKSSSSSSTVYVRTNCDWKAAMLHQIPIATRRRSDSCRVVMDSVRTHAASRRLSWNQPWYGMALRGGLGDAGTKWERGREVAPANCLGPRISNRMRGGHGCFSRADATPSGYPIYRRVGAACSWGLLSDTAPSSAVGSNASGLPRPDGLVVFGSVCAWRRPYGAAGVTGG